MDSIAHLTNRQRQVLQLASEGLTNDEIAKALSLSANTVPHIFERIYRKFGIRQPRAEAVWRFLQHGGDAVNYKQIL